MVVLSTTEHVLQNYVVVLTIVCVCVCMCVCCVCGVKSSLCMVGG